MIGKPEWFQRRKYGGWGISPKTWQGWVYIAVFIIPFVIFHSITFWSNTTRISVTVIWLGLLFFDAFDIMIHLRKDEREYMHEAVAERNAAWVMITLLALGLVYQLISSGLQNKIYFDPVIAIALFGGVAAKAITNIYLDKKQ